MAENAVTHAETNSQRGVEAGQPVFVTLKGLNTYSSHEAVNLNNDHS